MNEIDKQTPISTERERIEYSFIGVDPSVKQHMMRLNSKNYYSNDKANKKI